MRHAAVSLPPPPCAPPGFPILHLRRRKLPPCGCVGTPLPFARPHVHPRSSLRPLASGCHSIRGLPRQRRVAMLSSTVGHAASSGARPPVVVVPPARSLWPPPRRLPKDSRRQLVLGDPAVGRQIVMERAHALRAEVVVDPDLHARVDVAFRTEHHVDLFVTRRLAVTPRVA